MRLFFGGYITADSKRKEESPEMARFNDALRGVMRVSKEDLKELLAKEKAANTDKPKRGPKPRSVAR
jgi:hypothetical protein